MGSIFGAVLVLGIAVWGIRKAGQSTGNNKARTAYSTMRCPNCGAEARVYGSTWECGWCGDFGKCIRK